MEEQRVSGIQIMGGTGQGDQDYPHNVVITFGKDVTFQSFSYTPRKEGENTNGNIKGVQAVRINSRKQT